MPRALSWGIIVLAFTAGLYLPDLVVHAAATPRKDASAVAVEGGPEADAPRAVPGLASGNALDGEQPDKITPLNVRDPSAMVMGPSLGGKTCQAAPACDCSQDSLHRYQPKAPKRKKKP